MMTMVPLINLSCLKKLLVTLNIPRINIDLSPQQISQLNNLPLNEHQDDFGLVMYNNVVSIIPK